jgi:hypothetical protein
MPKPIYLFPNDIPLPAAMPRPIYLFPNDIALQAAIPRPINLFPNDISFKLPYQGLNISYFQIISPFKLPGQRGLSISK